MKSSSRTHRSMSIATRLNTARLAINNTLNNPALLARVEAYGYTAERIAEGQALLAAANSAVNAQRVAAGELRRAVANLGSAELAARERYQALAKIARAVFAPGSPQRVALAMAGTTPKSTSGFLSAAERMYGNALGKPELQAALGTYGFDAARLTADYTKVTALAAALEARGTAASAAQAATRAQNDATAALAKWVGMYMKVARIALSDTPEQLVSLGAATRARPRTARRATA